MKLEDIWNCLVCCGQLGRLEIDKIENENEWKKLRLRIFTQMIEIIINVIGIVCGIFFCHFYSLVRSLLRATSRVAAGQSLRRKLPSLTVKKSSENSQEIALSPFQCCRLAVAVPATLPRTRRMLLCNSRVRRKRKWDEKWKKKRCNGGKNEPSSWDPSRRDSDRKWPWNDENKSTHTGLVCSSLLLWRVEVLNNMIENENCTISLSGLAGLRILTRVAVVMCSETRDLFDLRYLTLFIPYCVKSNEK